MMSKEWMTMQEAADYIGVSYGRFSTKVKEGVFPAFKVPGFEGVYRFSRSRLDQLMYENEQQGKNGERLGAE